MLLDSKKEAIEDTTKDLLSRNKPIVRLQLVKEEVEDKTGLDVS